MKIALLGWGSLLWDEKQAFDCQHHTWQFDGPELRLEFSRISQSRNRALTLVIDEINGEICKVAYAISKRPRPRDAAEDLRSREGTCSANIGIYSVGGRPTSGRHAEALASISAWAEKQSFDSVIWTDLESNFEDADAEHRPFSVANAISHLTSLGIKGSVQADEYLQCAPTFVDTPLRRALLRQKNERSEFSGMMP